MQSKISASRRGVLQYAPTFLAWTFAAFSFITLPACKATLVDWQNLVNDDSGVTGEPSPDEEDNASQAEETDQQEHDYGPLTPIMPIPQPFATIPAPLMVTSPSDDGYAAVYAPAATYSDPETDTLMVQNTTQISALYSNPLSRVIRTAYAEDSDPCDAAYTVCITIQSDGSAQGYIESDVGDEFSVSYYDTATELSGSGTDVDGESYVLWTASAPQDAALTSSGTNAYVVTAEAVVDIAFDSDGERFVTQGLASPGDSDEESSYELCDVTGDESIIDWDGTNSRVAMNSLVRISVQDTGCSLFGELLDDTIVSEESYASDYVDLVAMKYKSVTPVDADDDGARIFYGLRYDTAYAQPLGKIREFYDNDDRALPFLWITDDHRLQQILAFDITTDSWALVAYEDETGGVRVRVSDGDAADAVGGDETFSVGTDLQLEIVQDQYDTVTYPDAGDDTVDGFALLLDKDNNQVIPVRFDYLNWAAFLGGDAREVDLLTDSAVTVGTVPTMMTLSGDGTKAYVVNQGDETVSVIDISISGETITTSLSSTINLRDYTNHSFDFTAQSIAYSTEGSSSYLLIGSQNTNSIITIPLE